MRLRLVLIAAGLAAASIPPQSSNSWDVTFTDVAERAGLVHPSIYGGVDRKRFIIETNGSGTAFVDYDNDGWVDLFVLSGTRLAPCTRIDSTDDRDRAPSRLSRNPRDGTFKAVTLAAGPSKLGWAYRVFAVITTTAATSISSSPTTAPTCCITISERTLRRRDITGGRRRAGFDGALAAFVDHDRDGRLDLFVANYLKFDLPTASEPGPESIARGRASPSTADRKVYRPIPTFSITTGGADSRRVIVIGHRRVKGSVCDDRARRGFRRGWLDGHLRCLGSTAAILYRNNHDGVYRHRDPERCGVRENGNPQAGMGVAAGDFDGDRRLICSRHTSPTTSLRFTAMLETCCSKTSRRAWSPAVTSSMEPECQTGSRRPSDIVYVTGNVYPEVERACRSIPIGVARDRRNTARDTGRVSRTLRRSWRGATAAFEPRRAFGDFARRRY